MLKPRYSTIEEEGEEEEEDGYGAYPGDVGPCFVECGDVVGLEDTVGYYHAPVLVVSRV